MKRWRLRPWGLGAVCLVAAIVGVAEGIRLSASPLDGHSAENAAAPGDGLRLQRHIAEIVMRDTGLSHRSDPIVITVGEANAFLAQHFKAHSISAETLLVQLAPGAVEVVGRFPLGAVLEMSPAARLRRFVPARLQALPLWLHVGGSLTAVDGWVTFQVERAAVGRQAVPLSWLSGLNDTGGSRWRWRLPRVVDRLEVDTGRIVLWTRRAPGRPPGR